MAIDQLRVAADRLRPVCDPDALGFDTTDEIGSLEGTLGQPRAVSAIETALNIDTPGFNLCVSGFPGTGRNSTLQTYLERVAGEKGTPPDWGYVFNFEDPSQPVAVSLPCGQVRALAHDMARLVETCRHEITRAFESDDYSRRVEEVMREVQERRQGVISGIEREAQQRGFMVQSSQFGITPVPMRDGRAMTPEEFAQLPDAAKRELTSRAEEVQRSIARALQEMRRLSKEAGERVQQVDAELVRFTLTPIIDELQEKYSHAPEVVAYLDHVQNDMVEHVDVFKPREEERPALPFMAPPREEDFFTRYMVNPLVDNTRCNGAPVIFEYSPTYYNLFGRVDYRARMGALTTDHTMVRPGAVHRASGGYLVLQLRDLLLSPLSWETLKRTLRSRKVQIENLGDQYSAVPSATLRPQPIPVNAKIILVGSPELVRLLQAVDEDFMRYFKVVADFDTVMDRTPDNIEKYAAFIKKRCQEEGLRPFHKSAVAAIIDYSSRIVEDQEKLTTRFMSIADMITEADYWAGRDGGTAVMGEHVQKAIEQRRYRNSLTEDKIQEFIEKGTIHIDTAGKDVGQVNGLAVYSIGEYSFGKPSRITARVSLGRGQVINIERETQLSGRIHNKGFMILTGYLQGKYGQDKPLSLSASIGFEQTYNEVDGDSASSTELYALLSELSGLGLDQGIAVTGSVDQAGEVQAIGGATPKIEGFFEVCKAKGLNGRQGVMIPEDNVRNLVLNSEVVEAVREGRFHIYAVSNVDEGMEILTGVPAGERRDDGSYPEGTMNYLVEKRLREMAQAARQFSRPPDEGDGQRNDRVE